tara:strand:+ start:875 stop:1714 length:840 start_codon:yes stop_codon:yes gene_type:complete
MDIKERNGSFYLRYSFRKKGKVNYREKYLGKAIPKNIEEIKEMFIRECLSEDVFKKLRNIKKLFQKEWSSFPESIKKKIILDLAIKFTYNTNAIEGSTITLDETEDVIKRRIAPNKSLDDVEETINHAKVFLIIMDSKKELSLSKVLNWHSELFLQTKPDIAGKLRDYPVRVGKYRCPDWQDVKSLLEYFFEWYNQNKSTLNAVELAARAHYKFEKIHPFGDGNGRIGRLIIAHILRRKNYPILIIDYKKRKSYYHALSKEENKFLQYFIRRYLKKFKD